MTEFKGPIVEGAYYLRDNKWLVGPLTSDQARYYSTRPEAFTGRAWVTHTDPAEVVAELREMSESEWLSDEPAQVVLTQAADLVAEKLVKP